MDCSPPLSPWGSPGKNTGVGCQSLLQGIFMTQGWNPYLPHLLHWQVNSLQLSHPGSPRWTLAGATWNMEELRATGYQSRGLWDQREEAGGRNSGLEMQLHLVRIANAFYTGCQHPKPLQPQASRAAQTPDTNQSVVLKCACVLGTSFGS